MLDVPPPFADDLKALEKANPVVSDPRRWSEACQDAKAFLAQWGAEAQRIGWRAEEIFGLHPSAPLARYDRMGLVWALKGRVVIELTEKAAILEGATNFYRQ
jgi:hypothetical protein